MALLLAGALLVGLSPTASASTARAGEATSTGGQAASPLAPTSYVGVSRGFLDSVSCPASTDCWAVGAVYLSSSSNRTVTLIEDWNGTTWLVVAGATPHGAVSSALYGVSCVSPADCWAVGYSVTSTKAYALTLVLFEHWDGRKWSIVASPSDPPGTTGIGLSSIACSSGSSCVAVGDYFKKVAPGQLTLVEQWNGSRWAVVPSPNPPREAMSWLTGVACSGAADCWAVGDYSYGAIYGTFTLTEYWNGKTWSIVSSPNPPNSLNISFSAVTCTSATSCVAVGDGGSLMFSQGTLSTLVESWNGKAWSIVSSPNSTSWAVNILSAVSCTASADCVAVGLSATKMIQPSVTLAESWNGRDWAILLSPNAPGSWANVLSSVSCAGTKTCFAVGYFARSGTYGGSLIERWDGTSWSLSSTTPPLVITTSSLPFGTVGKAYSASVTADGGSLPYSWSRISGIKPPGLAFSMSGVWSGTPTKAGSFSFTVQVTDSAGKKVDKGLRIVIATPLTIATSSLPSGRVGAVYEATVKATGGSPPYSWSRISGIKPPGLTFSTSGVWSGTPTKAGSFSFTVQVTDSAGQKTGKVLRIVVASA